MTPACSSVAVTRQIVEVGLLHCLDVSIPSLLPRTPHRSRRLSLLASLLPACLHHTRPMSRVPAAVQHSMGPMLTNWMGNVHLKQAVTVSPRSIEELQQCVASASAPLRVMGSGHSFTPLCVCEEVGTLVDMHNLRCVWDLRVGDGCSSISCEGGTSLSYF